MENFDSELKSMILKWLKRGYHPMCIRDAMVANGQLFDTLSDAQDYLEAIEQGKKVNTTNATNAVMANYPS